MSADREQPGAHDDDGGVDGGVEHGGDYGYDLAHEVSAALQHTPRPRSVLPTSPTATAPLWVDVHGDLGYDSAHEGGS